MIRGFLVVAFGPQLPGFYMKRGLLVVVSYLDPQSPKGFDRKRPQSPKGFDRKRGSFAYLALDRPIYGPWTSRPSQNHSSFCTDVILFIIEPGPQVPRVFFMRGFWVGVSYLGQFLHEKRLVRSPGT